VVIQENKIPGLVVKGNKCLMFKTEEYESQEKGQQELKSLALMNLTVPIFTKKISTISTE
jgi:hypothetical protein